MQLFSCILYTIGSDTDTMTPLICYMFQVSALILTITAIPVYKKCPKDNPHTWMFVAALAINIIVGFIGELSVFNRNAVKFGFELLFKFMTFACLALCFIFKCNASK